MTAYETLRLFVAIVAIYAVPAAIFWYFVDRKIKVMEEQLYNTVDVLAEALLVDITNINSRLRKIT